jgi:hypothetical protein
LSALLKPLPYDLWTQPVATSPRQSLIARFHEEFGWLAVITNGGLSMAARVGRGLAWSLHDAIPPSRRNFAMFWPHLNLRDSSVVLTVCNLRSAENSRHRSGV